jgi:hypothetical protein
LKEGDLSFFNNSWYSAVCLEMKNTVLLRVIQRTLCLICKSWA